MNNRPQSSSNLAIEVTNLTKRYIKPEGLTKIFVRNRPETLAVDQVNLSIKQSELFGLVGPNGAGKTTLIKMLCTLILPSSGSAIVDGYPLEQDTAIKSIIGLVTSDERSFYWRLSGRQNLEFFATLQNISPKLIPARVDDVLAIVNLQDVADQRFQTYSTGMRQRLSIARAMINKPTLLFLDEPTKGLDPPSIHAMHKLMREQLVDNQGITVFLTSHWLEEVEQLCDRIAIMNLGRIVACGTMDELRQRLSLGEKYLILINNINDQFASNMRSKYEDVAFTSLDNDITQIEVKISADTTPINQILDDLRDSGGRIIHLSNEKVTLDEIFTHHIELKLETAKSLLPKPQEIDYINEYKAENIKPSGPSGLTDSIPNKRIIKPVNPLRIAWAFLKRDVHQEVSYRFSFLLQFFSVFFSVALFYFLASFLGDAAAPYLEPYGGDYFAFVLIGIAFAGYFGVGLSSFADSLRQAQTTGTLEAMLTTPTRLSTIIISSSLWSYLMTTIRVAMFLLIGAVFVNVNLGDGNYPLAILVLILTIISFSSLGIIAASFIMVLKRGNPITWLFSSTSNLLGGIYYPISVLPNWLLVLSYMLPITYALRAMRLALLQGASFEDVLVDILALTIFCVVLLPVSLFSFRYAVRKAKVDGSLTQY